MPITKESIDRFWRPGTSYIFGDAKLMFANVRRLKGTRRFKLFSGSRYKRNGLKLKLYLFQKEYNKFIFDSKVV